MKKLIVIRNFVTKRKAYFIGETFHRSEYDALKDGSIVIIYFDYVDFDIIINDDYLGEIEDESDLL